MESIAAWLMCYTRRVKLSHFSPALLLALGCGEVVNDTSLPPRADAGADVSVNPGTPVTLDGSASTAGDAPIDGFRWTIVAAPEASSASLSADDSPSATFTPDVLGNYLVTLVVSAAGVESEPDVAIVTARSVNRPPSVSVACGPGSNCEVLHGQMAQLDGRDTSDPEGDALTVQWSQVVSPAGCEQCRSLTPCEPSNVPVTLSNTDSLLARFIAPSEKDLSLVFALTVSDETSTVSDCISFVTTNQAPTVLVDSSNPVASPPINPGTIAEGSTFTLAAASSFDPDGDALSFTWTQIAGSPEAFSSPLTGDSVNVTAPTLSDPPGTTPSVELTFEVVVTDGIDETSAELTVTIENN